MTIFFPGWPHGSGRVPSPRPARGSSSIETGFAFSGGSQKLCKDALVTSRFGGAIRCPIFVELKGSGWEGELTPNEIAAGRQHSDKCINAEARAVGPIGRVVYAMEKALPKLDASRGNLVVVVDDLFISPTELPKGCLASSLAHKIKATDFRPISGLFLINPVSYGSPVEYRKYFVANPNAVTALPDTVAEGLSMGNADPQAPRWARE